MSGGRAAEVQKLYLSGTRKKCPCSAGTRRADVIGKTRAGKFYLPRLHFKPAPRTSSKSSVGRSIRRAGARPLRRPRCFSVARGCLGAVRGVRRCRPDRRRANCDAESVQQRWPRGIGASGERGGVRRGGLRCFRRYRAPRSGDPTSWPTIEALSFCEPPHGGLQAGCRGANACPRLASSASFVSRPVSYQGERKRHGEHRDCGALAW
jgi:hypothetical protein